MRSSKAALQSFLAITSTGFAATIAQILVLRELLVLFYGNEISTGLIFACWLLWTALGSGLSGRLAARFPPRITILVFLLSLLAAMLPILVFMIRAARTMWSIPVGELPSLGKMIFISISVTGLFCPVSGAAFGICWSLYRQKRNNCQVRQPLQIYMGEAMGAAAGGLVFYFYLLPYVQSFTAAVLTSVVLLTVSWWILQSEHLFSGNRISFTVLSGISFLILLCVIFGSHLENMGRRLQWGNDLIAVHDTPYHNIAVIQKKQQVSVFTNGLWLFSAPDILSAENAVHPALLQHPRPKIILLLGGGIAGHIEEILKYPEIQRIDYVEPDPDLIPFIENHLSSKVKENLHHDRVNLYNEDATRFIRNRDSRYDVILMNMGDPINAESNRFYTKEFFEQISRRLLPGGIFSFAVSGGKEMMGQVQARLISSINKTLISVFPNVLIFPGDHSRFFATDISGTLSSDVFDLTDRIQKRKLELSYIRQDTLFDTLNPFRMDYLKSILAEFEESRINKDFSPICYFHALRLWAFQWHPRLEQLLTFMASVKLSTVWAALVIMGAAIPVVFWIGPLRFNAAVATSVIVSGALEMMLQIILLLTFQVLEGFLYKQLALVIAFFMAGMGLGAGYISWWKKGREINYSAVSHFFRVQAMFSIFPLFLMLLFPLIHQEFRIFFSSTSIGWIFSCLSLITGFLGGTHFSLAVSVYTISDSSSEKIGGLLYALDLAGSAGGALIASFFVLPVFGLINTLMLMSVLALISLLTLLRHP